MGQRRLQVPVARIEPREAAEEPSEQPLEQHPNGGEQPGIEQGRPPEPCRGQLPRRQLPLGSGRRFRRRPQQNVEPTLQQRKQGQAADEQQHQKTSQHRRGAAVKMNADIDPAHPHAVLAQAIGKTQRRPRRGTIQQPKPPGNGHQAQRPPAKRRQAQRQQRPKAQCSYRRSCGKYLRAQSGSIARCVTIPLACPIFSS